MPDNLYESETTNLFRASNGYICMKFPYGYYPKSGTENPYVYKNGNFFGDAAAGDVVINKRFTSSNGLNMVGTMTNVGTVTKTLNCGESYTITGGKHSGSGKVTANSLASQTVGNLTAGTIRSGYYGYSNGVKVTGNIASLAAQTITPSSSAQTVSCSGKYMTGNVTVSAIPSGYVNLSRGATVFNNGSFLSGYGWGPKFRKSISATPYAATADAVLSSTWQIRYISVINKSFNFSNINKVVVTFYINEAYEKPEDSNKQSGTSMNCYLRFISTSDKTKEESYLVHKQWQNGDSYAGDTVTATFDTSSYSGWYWIGIQGGTSNGSADDGPYMKCTIKKVVIYS